MHLGSEQTGGSGAVDLLSLSTSEIAVISSGVDSLVGRAGCNATVLDRFVAACLFCFVLLFYLSNHSTVEVARLNSNVHSTFPSLLIAATMPPRSPPVCWLGYCQRGNCVNQDNKPKCL